MIDKDSDMEGYGRSIIHGEDRKAANRADWTYTAIGTEQL